jgi:hypothetical protein
MFKQNPMGDKNEQKFHPLLNRLYGEVVKTKQFYDVIDFVSVDGSTKIEMKSRTNYYNTYPTTIFGANKLKFCFEKPHKKYVFVFVFLDGVYEWIFSLENYERAGGDSAITIGQDPVNHSKANFNIPIAHLKKISSEGCIITANMKDRVPLPSGKCFIKIKKTCC